MKPVPVLLLIVSLLGPATSVAQNVPDRPTCPTCTFQLQPIATLGTRSGPGYLRDTFAQIRIDRNGRYWVLDSDELPKVFAPNGAFIRTIGSRGDGPGELRNISWYFTVPGDSLAVVETMGRAHMISPDLRVTRTWMMAPGAWEAHVIRWPDSVVMNGVTGNFGELGPSLHLFSAKENGAALIRSLGYATDTKLGFNDNYAMHRQYIIPLARGEFWTLDAGRYKWRRWTRGGIAVDSLERRPSWFAEDSRMNVGSPTSPPGPRVSGGSIDEAGRLWTYILVPVPNYADAWRKKDIPSGGDISLKAFDIDAMFKTIVEVMDPRSRRVIARSSFDRPVKEVLPGNRILFYSMSDDVPQANVYSIRLIMPQ